MDIEAFRKQVYSYYETNKRSFPWRDNPSEYAVFISEVMLQQTQAGSRTIEKFNAFIERFPSFHALAAALLSDVLKLWQGLGYNRRALMLKKAAEIIVTKYNGELPRTVEELDALPGIGYATACSISAFAFNEPVVFIETNVRTVFIYHFFPGRNDVSDAELMPLVEQALESHRPREWYSALMDYGSSLKKSIGNESRRSRHYTKQSKFEGSDRQIRGEILRRLATQDNLAITEALALSSDALRVKGIIYQLVKEGLIIHLGEELRIA